MHKKYLSRRILDSYSEIMFSKLLIKKNQSPFFPFQDKGIDIVSIDNSNNTTFYQLKARNLSVRNGLFRFKVKSSDLEKFPDTINSYWVFCCYLENGDFDFFVVPFNVLKKWHKRYTEMTKETSYKFFRIKPLSEKVYRLAPEWLAKEFDIQKYHINI